MIFDLSTMNSGICSLVPFLIMGMAYELRKEIIFVACIGLKEYVRFSWLSIT